MPKRRGRKTFLMLTAAAVLTIVFWRMPGGGYIVYPFTILATWFHEMGHGLSALMIGGRFDQLLLFPSGSGVAVYSGRLWGGDLGRALVAGGGPIGPPLVGAFFIAAGRYPRTARTSLILLALILGASVLLWIRTLFGMIAVSALGAATLLTALKASPGGCALAIQLLGVQACISVFLQVDYLFTRHAVIGGRPMLSDTGQIADSLFFPYWFWGALLAGTSFFMLAAGLRFAYRR